MARMTKARQLQVERAIGQAESMLNAVTGRAFSSLESLPDRDFERIKALGLKSLMLQAIAKAQAAMSAINEDELADATVAQKAMVAGILTDKAEKLAQLVGGQQVDEDPITAEGFRKLESLIRGRVSTLQAFGVKVTLDSDGSVVKNAIEGGSADVAESS